jgi:arylsulfate sulfotransferase
MQKNANRVFRIALILGLAGMVLACGNSTTPPSSISSPTALVSLSVSPALVIVGTSPSASTQLTANVKGSSNGAVTWSVNAIAGGNATVGTISPGGLYTSPAAPTSAVVNITATSAADTTKSSSSSVVLVSSTVSPTQNPQVAQYSFTSPTPAAFTVQFGTDTAYGLQTWTQHIGSAGGTSNMLVAGMRASTTYHMRISASFAGGVTYLDADHTFMTGALPANRPPSITITVPAGPQTNPGVQLLSMVNQFTKAPANPYQAAAVDLQGNVIWYYDISTIPQVGSDLPFPIKLLPNGHMKLVIGSAAPSPVVSMVQEIDLAGNLISEMTTADLNAKLAAIGSPIVSLGFHHDFAVLPNGHTIYLVMEQRNVTLTGDTTPTLFTGDSLVDIDPNGNLVWTWSTFDHFDPNYHPFQVPPGCGLPGAPICDWTHGNAIVYSIDDGNLVMSSRSLSWITKIDYQNGAGTGNVLWKLGPGGDFTLEGGGPSDWFYNEHYPNLLSRPTVGTFTLGVWDNGNTRPDPISGIPCGDGGLNNGGPPCYSRALIMTINESAKTAAIAWQDNLSPLFALCCGNISVLANGDVDIGAGGDSFTPPATEALEVTQTATPVVVWQMNVSNQFSYRMVRIPSLYPGVTW